MGKFLTELQVKEITRAGLFKKAHYVLTSPLVYKSNNIGLIVVDTGTDTDFDSTPRLPLFYWLLGDRGKAAAVLHDHLYASPHAPIAGFGHPVNRETADKVLRGATYECLRVNDPESLLDSVVNILSLGVVWLIWAGARVGGWAYWK